MLLEKAVDVNSGDNYSRMPLSQAARHEYEAGVRLLLENGADVNSKDDDDWIETDEWYDSDTPLSFATKYRDEAMVGLLLEKGGDADSKIRWILHRCRWPRQKNMRTQLSK